MLSISDLLNDYTFCVVSLGAALLGGVSGVLGSFAVLRKQSLVGDGVSHAALPGVVLAFLFTGEKTTEVLLLGALFTGILAIGCMLLITKFSCIKFDAALAMVMSVFFGLGMVLLTYVQKIPSATQAGLKRFIFGQASTLLIRDVVVTAVCGVVLLFVTALLWKELKVFSFDTDYAASIGFSVKMIHVLLSAMIVTATIIGLQTVGVVLMSAMLVAPAAAARQWTNRLSTMVFLAAFFGALSGMIGTIWSSAFEKTPTGPAIVLSVSVIVLFSLLFAPNRGILFRLLYRRKQRKGEVA